MARAKKSLWLAAVSLVLVSLTTRCLLLPHVFTTPSVRASATLPGQDSIWRQRILDRWQAARGANDVALRECQTECAAALAHLDGAQGGIASVVDELTSYAGCGRLSLLMARDRLTGGSRAEAAIQQSLERHVLPYVRVASGNVDAAMARLQDRLQASHTALCADLLEVASGAGVAQTALPYGDTVRALHAASQTGLDIARRTVSAGLGLGLEALFVRSTLRAAANVLGRVVARLSTTAAVSAGAAVADGPFPWGDAIGVAIAAVGTGWSSYDLYKAQAKLKSRLAADLQESLAQCRADLEQAAADDATRLGQASDAAGQTAVDHTLVELSAAGEQP